MMRSKTTRARAGFGSNGFKGDLCAPFGPFFDGAVGVIDSACDEFIPAG